MLMWALTWTVFPFVFTLRVPDLADAARANDGTDSLALPAVLRGEQMTENFIEPFELLLRAQGLKRLTEYRSVQGATGSLMQSRTYDRIRANEETSHVPEVVKNLFAHAKYGAHNFADIGKGEKDMSYAICTGKPEDKPDMTLLSLVSISNPKEYAELLHANRIKHAEMHGMAYCAYNHPLGQHLHVNRVVSKLTGVKTLHEMGHKAVVWMDADAVIMNHQRDFKEVMTHNPEKDIIWSSDFDEQRGQQPSTASTINSGVFIMKNTVFTQKLLDACTKYQMDVSTDSTINPDQTAIWDFRHKNTDEFNNHAVIIPWTTMNSWGAKYEEGDFVVHMAGGDHVHNKYFTLVDRYMHDKMNDVVKEK